MAFRFFQLALLSLALVLSGCIFDSDKSRISLTDGPINPPAPDEADDGDGDDNGDDNGGGDGDEASGRTRYAFANRCVVIQSAENDKFIAATNGLYGATANGFAEADAFFFKPTGLGDYLLYNRAGQLVSVANGVGMNTLAAATDSNVFTVRVAGDNTQYIQPPVKDREPSLAEITAYRSFNDPNIKGELFTLDSAASSQRLGVNESGQLAQGASAQQFKLHKAKPESCAEFPEANNNAEGEPFKGTTDDGRVLGMADVHVHLTATNFLGNAQYGDPFHRFGVTHALGDCRETHGTNGMLDVVGSLLGNDFDGHATDGWPTLTDWPSRGSLTHEAIYWKWVERAWMSGLRIMVNDLVENETLCEIQRNVTKDPSLDCNEMNSAARQVGTLYALQDYIDAQYRGRGKGWFRIVLTPEEARAVIAEGKLAVVIGLEISNVLDCKLIYNPLRTQEPFEETGSGLNENRYTCDQNVVRTQLDRLLDLGVRQIITIHEFDNAFGGNGIFDGLVLNLGNRENTGGIPSQDLNKLTGLLTNPMGISPLGYIQSAETPTGEFWTTYDCPTFENMPLPSLSGYLGGGQGGTMMTSLYSTGLPEELCPYMGQGGRPGGITPCYPNKRQCNARWMTPMGLFAYTLLMEKGLIFDIDHLELEMKTQALELAEAQPIPYPFVSTHGTFGGTGRDQARRILKNEGFLYPSLSNGPRLIRDMEEMKSIWLTLPEPRPFFGFGFGTDTNGLSAQASPRGNVTADKAVRYPYDLFVGTVFDELTDFSGKTAVRFFQPEERDAQGNGRTWSLDVDGSAHYGMMSGLVEEMRLEGQPEHMQNLFNSAERFIQTWERTLEASAAINEAGGAVTPEGILRPAPKPVNPLLRLQP